MKRIIFLMVFFVFAGLALPDPVLALMCYPQRVINQHRCVSTSGSCTSWRSQSRWSGCSNTSGTAQNAKNGCESSCAGPYANPQCYEAYCVNYGSTTYQCQVESFVAGCTGEPSCQAIANIASCQENYAGCPACTPPIPPAPCSQTTQTLTYGCWGPGGTPAPTSATCGNGVCGSGETCTNCPSDCGACCGNGSCGAGETCSNCAADCGSCPPTCGNGSCGAGENCSNCPSDCGPCFDPTHTPTPTSGPTPFCGNGSCSAGENCTNCPSDCGNCPADSPTPTPTPDVGQCEAPTAAAPTSSCAACPSCSGTITWSWGTVTDASEYELAILDSTNALVLDIGWLSAASYDCASDSTCSYTTSLPPGTYKSRIRARGSCNTSTFFYSTEYPLNICSGTIGAVGKKINSNATSCQDVSDSNDYVPNISFQLSPNVTPGAQIQTGSDPVTWTNVSTPATYQLSVSPPSGYVVRFMCWQRSFTNPLTGDGPTASNMVNGETFSWYGIGLSLGTPWVQTEGGDVLVATNIQSHMADTVIPREFNIAGTGGYPGVVSYGTSYDFDPSATGTGANLVSANGWIARETNLPLYTKDWYSAFAQKYDLTGNSQPYTGPAKPASSTTPYYYNGNTSIGNWAVANGENIVLFVNGDVSITGPITTTGTGFVAIIASGDISISQTVGVAYTSSTPSIEGLYVTNDTFSTGQSQTGIQRLVLRGTFIANTFDLQRDLETAAGGQNHTTSAELFIYDPQLMFAMPDEFRDIRLKWEETAP